MVIEPLVGLGNQPAVEPPFRAPGLVASDEQNAAPFRIEGECNSPDAAFGFEPEFLHVGVPGPVQGVGVWATKPRPKDFQQPGAGQQFVLHRLPKVGELPLERLMKGDFPFHD